MRSDLRFLMASWGAGMRAALEYRVSFLMQASFMLLNNLIFLAFWAIFFARFHAIRGWELGDVALLYAISATGFGLSVVLMGGYLRLAPRIAQGELDTWLLRPRPLFLQVGASRMQLAGFGDIGSGVLLMAVAGHPTPKRIAVYLLMALASATVACCFGTICNSTAFYFGRVDDLAWQSFYALITFSLYPPSLFSGWVRVLLYVLVPAGLMSHLPATLLREWSYSGGLELLVGIAVLALVTHVVWREGLRRYESGNLTQAGMN